MGKAEWRKDGVQTVDELAQIDVECFACHETAIMLLP